jgi:hypothetical protein
MSAAAQSAHAAPTTRAMPPARPFRLAMLIPTLIVDGLLPVAIFKGLEALGVAPVWALAGGCLPPILNNLRVWITARRLDPIGLLIMASIASGVVASMISGGIGSRIITDCLLNGAWGLAFLGSLACPRPLLFYLIRSVVAGDDASRTEAWNGLWRYAMLRRMIRSTTAIWGVVYYVEVLFELGLARLSTPDTVLTVAPIVNAAATVALLVFTRLRMRRVRERLELFEHLKWPL